MYKMIGTVQVPFPDPILWHKVNDDARQMAGTENVYLGSPYREVGEVVANIHHWRELLSRNLGVYVRV